MNEAVAILFLMLQPAHAPAVILAAEVDAAQCEEHAKALVAEARADADIQFANAICIPTDDLRWHSSARS